MLCDRTFGPLNYIDFRDFVDLRVVDMLSKHKSVLITSYKYLLSTQLYYSRQYLKLLRHCYFTIVEVYKYTETSFAVTVFTQRTLCALYPEFYYFLVLEALVVQLGTDSRRLRLMYSIVLSQSYIIYICRYFYFFGAVVNRNKRKKISDTMLLQFLLGLRFNKNNAKERVNLSVTYLFFVKNFIQLFLL